MTTNQKKQIRLFDKDNKTLGYMEFDFDATFDQMNKCIEDFAPFNEGLAGYEILRDGYFKSGLEAMRIASEPYNDQTYYDGPEDNLHYTNER